MSIDGRIPLPNETVFEAKEMFYTCIGKGGLYRTVGRARGAGTSRETGIIIVYEDVNSLEHMPFFRTLEDFQERMQEVDINEIIAAQEQQ